MHYICPKCKAVLTEQNASAVCKNGHSFDRARQGYYNLLLGNGGGVHGDNRDMVEARRNFLSGGFYSPLADRVSQLVLANTPSFGRVLDAGCGEGYYTSVVEEALFGRDGQSNVLAFDISRDAVRYALRRCSRLNCAVASSYDMPIADSSVDMVINVFSPLALDEVKRVLKPQGHFVMVYPAEEHLYSLKAAIYDTPYKNKHEDTDIGGFSLEHIETLEYDIVLDKGEDIKNLFMMTPYAYRTSEKGRERLASLESLNTKASFIIALYTKK